jgi:disulfide bond formation protein DsbB
MDVRVAENFFGLLTIAANAVTVVVLAVALGSITSTGRALRDRLALALGGAAPGLLAVVALTTMAGSLYFSEVAGFVPCRYCWFARICLYPLAALFVTALALRGRAATVRPFAVPLAAAAIAVSGYHYMLEWYPKLETSACDLAAPCTAVWFRAFGFASLAWMSVSSGALILALLWLWRVADHARAGLEEDLNEGPDAGGGAGDGAPDGLT